MVGEFPLALEIALIEEAFPDDSIIEDGLRISLYVQVITQLVTLDANRKVDDDRFHRFLVGLFQCPYPPATVADEECTGVFMIRDHVNGLLLALFCQINGQLRYGSLQIKMPGVERARFDGL